MWNKLYNAAVQVQNHRTISPFIEAGGVAAAILTKAGNTKSKCKDIIAMKELILLHLNKKFKLAIS